ncbi:hypothetical protein FRC12_023705 [Ceratobasidium sp. 428]|nr:hypothetical protein FRC12_023705 [Ceratobasidium sp. 428]
MWLTGDARQLYPHELVRPLPPEHAAPPPVYSLSMPPQPDDRVVPPPPYEPRQGRKAPTDETADGVRTRKQRSGGNGILGRFGRNQDDVERDLESGMVIELDTHRTTEQSRQMDLKLALPAARKTKGLSRQSLGPSTLPAPSNLFLSEEPRLTAASTADVADSQMFDEGEDFGIVVSEAYEGDLDYPFPSHNHHSPRSTRTRSVNEQEASAPRSAGPEPLVPVRIQPTPDPEHMAPVPARRRGGLPDIFSFGSPPATPTSAFLAAPKPSKSPASPALDWVLSQSHPPARSKQQDLVGDDGVVLMNPRWRTLFGPMTLVHDLLVRRAHWAVTVRCAIVAGVMVCGMALGLIR